jgi:hypothetical protein
LPAPHASPGEYRAVDAMRLNIRGSLLIRGRWVGRHLRNHSRIVRWPVLLAHAIGRAHSWQDGETPELNRLGLRVQISPSAGGSLR